MKVTMHLGVCIALASFLTFSCGSVSNSVTANNTPSAEEQQAEVQVQEELPPPPTESELFAKKIEGLSLTLVSAPKETVKNKIFTSPYVVKVSDSEQKPVESFEISVVYPSSRKSGEVVFSETMITTDSEGNASFLPAAPEFAFGSEISFFPKFLRQVSETSELPPEESEKIAELQASRTVKAPFKVQTNLKSAGGIIAVVDFNQNGKAVTSNPVSSSNLLMTLMKLGFIGIGNAPQEVTDAVIRDDEAKIFSRGKVYAKNFLIFGKVTVDSSEKTDAGFSYTLTGSIKSMSMKTGKIDFVTEKTVTVTDKNDWNALANARKQLADALANEIKYGI